MKETLLGPDARGYRVGLLLAAIAAMSGADLWMTLTYATTTGMMELNPLARAVMSMGSPWMLAMWKMATVGLGIGVLYFIRTSRLAEIGTWLCFLAMCSLMVHWMVFNTQVTQFSEEVACCGGCDAPCWVQMSENH